MPEVYAGTRPTPPQVGEVLYDVQGHLRYTVRTYHGDGPHTLLGKHIEGHHYTVEYEDGTLQLLSMCQMSADYFVTELPEGDKPRKVVIDGMQYFPRVSDEAHGAALALLKEVYGVLNSEAHYDPLNTHTQEFARPLAEKMKQADDVLKFAL